MRKQFLINEENLVRLQLKRYGTVLLKKVSSNFIEEKEQTFHTHTFQF